VKLVDANVLLYAVNESDAKHSQARAWLDEALNGQEAVGFAWAVLLAFVRLSTKVGLFPDPLPVGSALATVRLWLEQPPSVVVEPSPRHLDVLGGLMEVLGTGGNLVPDAHLAALALEHGASVVSYDMDFGRFKGLRWGPPAPPA
jgi:toxin-antitoxin system PIN domain toxin